ncbi:MAG: hypothetical protein IPK60_03945 [Sandaracinaceae bacterium]|nr:hypothetical protein [Sandaracinaceae bacterium]
MTPISIPINEMTAFDLPKVCVSTGSTSNIVFKPVKFQWYPKWIAIFAIAPLIMVIVMLVMMRRVNGELPFSEDGWKQWKKNKLISGLGVAFAITCWVGAAFSLGAVADSNASPVFAILLGVVGLVALIVAVRMAQRGGPLVTKIDKTVIELKIPSADAASAISQHLMGGVARRAVAP